MTVVNNIYQRPCHDDCGQTLSDKRQAGRWARVYPVHPGRCSVSRENPTGLGFRIWSFKIGGLQGRARLDCALGGGRDGPFREAPEGCGGPPTHGVRRLVRIASQRWSRVGTGAHHASHEASGVITHQVRAFRTPRNLEGITTHCSRETPPPSPPLSHNSGEL